MLLLIISLVSSATKAVCLGFCLLQIALGCYFKSSEGRRIGEVPFQCMASAFRHHLNMSHDANLFFVAAFLPVLHQFTCLCVGGPWKLPPSRAAVLGPRCEGERQKGSSKWSDEIAALLPARAGIVEGGFRAGVGVVAELPRWVLYPQLKAASFVFSGVTVHLVLVVI